MSNFLKKASYFVKRDSSTQHPVTIYDGRVKVHRDGSIEIDYANTHVRNAIKMHVRALSNSALKEK